MFRILLFIGLAQQAVASHIVLTWSQPDTSSHIRVNFGSPLDLKESVVFYDYVSHAGKETSYAFRAEGTSKTLKDVPVRFHFVDLLGLEAGRDIFFVVKNSSTGLSEERKFRLISADSTDVSFADGGDMGVWSVSKIEKAAARTNPDFVVVGGDIAYGNGLLKNWSRWKAWLKFWTKNLVSSDGYTIPGVFSIGNHEVGRNGSSSEEKAPFFFSAIEQGTQGKTFFYRTFGRDLVFFILDSSHVYLHRSQVTWLDEKLEAFKDKAYKFAAYHAPLYPSHRSFNNWFATQGRKYWLPIFDKHQLTTAFEHHDHVLKRTKILRGGEEAKDGKGTLYLGDGCFGMPARTAQNRNYLNVSKSKKHFWHANLSAESVLFTAIGEKGEVYDRYTLARPE